MSDDRESFEQRDEDARLGQLHDRLVRAEATEAARTGADRPRANPQDRAAYRVLAELFGGILGGAIIGWLIDRLFETAPWGLLVMLGLGTIVAFRNVIRVARGQGKIRPD